jgi:hypothetical protein
MDEITARRSTAVHLGMPGFPDVAGRTLTATPDRPRPGREPS